MIDKMIEKILAIASNKKLLIIIGAFAFVLFIAAIGLILLNKQNKFRTYSSELVVIRNGGDNVYHSSDCPLVKKAVESLSPVVIMSKEMLAKNNYRPCLICKPPYDEKYWAEVQNKTKSEDVQEASAHEAEREAINADLNTNKGDLSKVKVVGHSFTYKKHGTSYTITCTVKNSDTFTHEVKVLAVFYDKKKKPIASADSGGFIALKTDEIKGFTIKQLANAEKIAMYELKVKESPTPSWRD